MVAVRTFDKNGWQEKPISALTDDGVVLGCECGRYVYFTIEEIVKAQSQEKYRYCDCDMQQLFYAKIIK